VCLLNRSLHIPIQVLTLNIVDRIEVAKKEIDGRSSVRCMEVSQELKLRPDRTGSCRYRGNMDMS
jgi:hypothetical protein